MDGPPRDAPAPLSNGKVDQQAGESVKFVPTTQSDGPALLASGDDGRFPSGSGQDPDAASPKEAIPRPDEESPFWDDPMARALLQWSPAVHFQPSCRVAHVSPKMIEHVASQLVRKAAVGASSVHLQFGAGLLEGGAVLVQSGPDGLEIRLTAPDDVDGAALASALSERLTRRGLRVARVVVD